MKKLISRLTIITILLISFSLIFYSCKKDKNEGGPIDNLVHSSHSFNNTEMTNATFTGQIVKEDGTPLVGAMVSTGTHSMITDEDGFFYFSNINTPQNATLISVQKAAYFKAFRTIHVIPNMDNPSKIMMMELPQPKQFHTNTASIVTIENGGAIEFPANAIIDELTMQPYIGNVNVYAKWIDPSSSSLSLLLPGALRGVNTEGVEEGLITFGMQGVELVGDNGQALQMGNGKKAKVNFPLPAIHLSAAPETIPLWHFNETNGMWIEEGSAIRSGNAYVGEVSHFSFWNVDADVPVVEFTCRITDQNDMAVSGAVIKLTPNGFDLGSKTALTNSQGMVRGKIPANASIDMAYACLLSNSIHTMGTIKTFNTTTKAIDLGTIKMNSTSSFSTLKGSVQNCDNEVLANAPIKLTINNHVIGAMSDANGHFTIRINCLDNSTPAVLTLYDPKNSVKNALHITLAPGSTQDMGVVQACGTGFNYLTWHVTNPPATSPTTYTIQEPLDYQYSHTYFDWMSIPRENFQIFEGSGPNQIRVHFSMESLLRGTSGVQQLQKFIDHNCNDNIAPVSFTPAVVNLTKHEGVVGGQIEGSFSTYVTSSIYTNALVECEFRLEIEE